MFKCYEGNKQGDVKNCGRGVSILGQETVRESLYEEVLFEIRPEDKEQCRVPGQEYSSLCSLFLFSFYVVLFLLLCEMESHSVTQAVVQWDDLGSASAFWVQVILPPQPPE